LGDWGWGLFVLKAVRLLPKTFFTKKKKSCTYIFFFEGCPKSLKKSAHRKEKVYKPPFVHGTLGKNFFSKYRSTLVRRNHFVLVICSQLEELTLWRVQIVFIHNKTLLSELELVMDHFMTVLLANITSWTEKSTRWTLQIISYLIKHLLASTEVL
jgi:hypothetical protein